MTRRLFHFTGIVVSSQNNDFVHPDGNSGRSDINKLYMIGPSIDPWGTPALTGSLSDFVFL